MKSRLFVTFSRALFPKQFKNKHYFSSSVAKSCIYHQCAKGNKCWWVTSKYMKKCRTAIARNGSKKGGTFILNRHKPPRQFLHNFLADIYLQLLYLMVQRLQFRFISKETWAMHNPAKLLFCTAFILSIME